MPENSKLLFLWKQYALVAITILFGLLSLVFNSKFELSAILGGLMILLWVFEIIPIYVTALLPLIFATPMGLLTPNDLALSYGNSNVFLFFGGFVLALGLEKWGVHEQISRRIISVVGNSKPKVLLGFILSTGLLSMWISNTATTLMMLPMAIAVIQSMPKHHQESKFSLYLMLSIAYASSIGGMATLVGSPPNTQMAAIVEQNFHTTVSFWDWMKIGIPVSLSLLLLMYCFFYWGLAKERGDQHEFNFKKEPWSSEQIKAIAIFLLVVFLWTCRELVIDFTGVSYRDEIPAILGAVLMFLIPNNTKKGNLLAWKDTEQLPWGILLLFGGGLALAAIFEKNGIVLSLTQLFNSYADASIFILILVVVTIAIFVTEIMSNLALVTLFVPIVGAFSIDQGLPVLQLCLPLTLAASCAFMLPVGTPPNAIVFASGRIRMHEMVRIGFVLNIISLVAVVLFCYLLLN